MSFTGDKPVYANPCGIVSFDGTGYRLSTGPGCSKAIPFGRLVVGAVSSPGAHTVTLRGNRVSVTIGVNTKSLTLFRSGGGFGVDRVSSVHSALLHLGRGPKEPLTSGGIHETLVGSVSERACKGMLLGKACVPNNPVLPPSLSCTFSRLSGVGPSGCSIRTTGGLLTSTN